MRGSMGRQPARRSAQAGSPVRSLQSCTQSTAACFAWLLQGMKARMATLASSLGLPQPPANM